jgi:hypothetical protein
MQIFPLQNLCEDLNQNYINNNLYYVYVPRYLYVCYRIKCFCTFLTERNTVVPAKVNIVLQVRRKMQKVHATPSPLPTCTVHIMAVILAQVNLLLRFCQRFS